MAGERGRVDVDGGHEGGGQVGYCDEGDEAAEEYCLGGWGGGEEGVVSFGCSGFQGGRRALRAWS